MKLTKRFVFNRPPALAESLPEFDTMPTEDLVLMGAMVAGKCAKDLGMEGTLIVGTLVERLRDADEIIKLVVEGLNMGCPADQILANDNRVMQLAREFINGKANPARSGHDGKKSAQNAGGGGSPGHAAPDPSGQSPEED